MEIWILAALAGWCPTGWPRWRLPPRPRPFPWPEPDPPGRPQPEPWIDAPWDRPLWPIIAGLFGAAGGVTAWALLGDRFGTDGITPVIAIAFLGGCVGLSIADALGRAMIPKAEQVRDTVA